MSPSPARTRDEEGWRPPPLWLGLLWGFAEGTVFFIVPDVLLGWASLAGLREGLKTLAALLIGSLAAGLVMYFWASWKPQMSRAVVEAVPFVRHQMFETVQRDYQDHGAAALLYGPGSGIPYKVYAILAPPACDPLSFLLVSLPARLERMALSGLLFTALGRLLKHPIEKHPHATAALFTLVWIVVYGLYWARI